MEATLCSAYETVLGLRVFVVIACKEEMEKTLKVRFLKITEATIRIQKL